MKKTEAEGKAGKMNIATYLMIFHHIRWALINDDIERMRF